LDEKKFLLEKIIFAQKIFRGKKYWPNLESTAKNEVKPEILNLPINLIGRSTMIE